MFNSRSLHVAIQEMFSLRFFRNFLGNPRKDPGNSHGLLEFSDKRNWDIKRNARKELPSRKAHRKQKTTRKRRTLLWKKRLCSSCCGNDANLRLQLRRLLKREGLPCLSLLIPSGTLPIFLGFSLFSWDFPGLSSFLWRLLYRVHCIGNFGNSCEF